MQVQPEVPVINNPVHLPVHPPYIRVVSKGRIIYRHPTGGQSYGKAKTQWEVERERNQERRGGNRWAMWGTQDEWESVKWMATTKVSQSSLNKLLALANSIGMRTTHSRPPKDYLKKSKLMLPRIRSHSFFVICSSVGTFSLVGRGSLAR